MKQLLTLDEIVSKIGGYGNYQFLTNIILTIALGFEVMSNYSIVLVTKTPYWKCSLAHPACNSTDHYSIDNNSNCHLPRSAWNFVGGTESIIATYELVCDRRWISFFPIAIFQLGTSLGSVGFGYISDNYGRRKAAIIGFTIYTVVSVISGFSRYVSLFLVCRFIAGACLVAMSPNFVVLMSEIVPLKHRSKMTASIYCSLPVFLGILGLTGYYVKNWRILVISTSVPAFLSALSMFYVPESLEWLLVHSKVHQANTQIQKIAKWNKCFVTNDLKLTGESCEKKPIKTSFFFLFSTREMTKRITIMMLVWLCTVIAYWGLAFVSQDISSHSIYLNFFLVCALAEIPALITLFFFIDRFGHKKPFFVNSTLCLISCVCLVFIPNTPYWKNLRLALGFLGRCLAGILYRILYPWNVSLFPASIRAQSFAATFCTCRVGLILFPLLVQYTRHVHNSISFAIIAVLLLFQLFAVFALPEKVVKSEESEQKPIKLADQKL